MALTMPCDKRPTSPTGPTSPTLCPVLKRSGLSAVALAKVESTVTCQRACHGVAERRWVLPAEGWGLKQNKKYTILEGKEYGGSAAARTDGEQGSREMDLAFVRNAQKSDTLPTVSALYYRRLEKAQADSRPYRSGTMPPVSEGSPFSGKKIGTSGGSRTHKVVTG